MYSDWTPLWDIEYNRMCWIDLDWEMVLCKEIEWDKTGINGLRMCGMVCWVSVVFGKKLYHGKEFISVAIAGKTAWCSLNFCWSLKFLFCSGAGHPLLWQAAWQGNATVVKKLLVSCDLFIHLSSHLKLPAYGHLQAKLIFISFTSFSSLSRWRILLMSLPWQTNWKWGESVFLV